MVGRLTTFRVVFENSPRGIFFDGQTMAGVVTINQRRSKQVKRIILVVIGKGRIRDIVNETHRDYNFLRQELVLADFMSGHLLTVGDYKYNFYYKLREKLCPTFYGRKGFVHYEVAISLIDDDGREGRPGMQYRHPFTVLRSMSMPRFHTHHKMKPVEQTKSIDVCYYCCTVSQPFDITVQFPSKAFCPGDWLFIRLICRTDLGEQLNLIKMKLMQNIKYTHMNGVETVCEQIKIAKVKTEYSANLKGKDFVVGMKIPLVHPTNENSFPDLVTITYHLEVEADLLTCCDDRARFDFKVPIHVQNLDYFTYDHCTHKKKKEVVTKQPLRKDASVSQTRSYPSTGWNPPAPPANSYNSPVYPATTELTKIGFDNVLRDTNTHKPGPPYPPPTIPSVISEDIPCPPYPTNDSTPTPPYPIMSIPPNSLTNQAKTNTITTTGIYPLTPPQNGPTFVPPATTVQANPESKGVPPYPENPSIPPSALRRVDDKVLSNTSIPLNTSTERTVTLSSHHITDPPVSTATTSFEPYHPVYDENLTAFAPTSPHEITYPPLSTKHYSPIPLSSSNNTELKNTAPSAPLLDDRTSADATTPRLEPVQPPSEVWEFNGPLHSVSSAVESSQLHDSNGFQNQAEELTQDQGLKKGRKKMLGERRKKF